MDIKPTNPKDAIGSRKARSWSSISWHVLREVSIAMLEGAMKYGRHNYRPAGVRASVYYDACLDHMTKFWEGEDIDPDSKLSHVTKAITSLVVLRDSMISGNWVDDRPPRTVGPEHVAEMQALVDLLFQKYPEPKPPFTASGQW